MNYYFVSFLFSLFLTSIGQPITYDPNNPYCAQFSGSICQSCGLSNSNTYALYDQICTPVVTSDEVLNGQIISRAPPHCSDYDGEYCQSCDNILDKSFYKDDGSSSTGFLFCVAECGYSSFGDDGSGECKSCPASCAVCKDKNTCLQCDYDLTRWQAQISSTNEGILNCSQHSERVNITSDDPNYTKIFYITPADRSCKSLGTCDGSLDNPYDDINLVLKNLIEETKIGQFFKMSIAIYLLKDNTNTYHFWLEDQALPVYYSRLFEGTMIDALIQPAVCEDLTKCFTDTEKATIYLKSNTISLFTAWKLNIKNIIFDASELIPDGTCYTTNKYTTNRCCNSSGDLPSRSNPTSDAICSLITPLNSLLVLPDLAYDPSVDIWPQGPYSFITLQPILDASDYEVPELLIESCEFKHFWYHRYARSLISLSHSGSKVTIKDTIFTNFYFRDGLITNAHSAIQRKTLFTSDVTPKFNCSGNSSDSCFSIWIEGSMFNYSLFDNTTYGRQSSIQNMSVQDNEGIILFLVSFDGPITLINNTFEKIASVQVSIAQPLSCQNASRIGSVSNHSLDRKIQFELGSEYLQNVRSSSLINIRNLVKGIIIYKNTFRNNIALTGTNFLIHNFDNTKDFPIIIEKNTFDTNLALAFGSSFALINYERDYVTMDCEGVYIYENLFTDNIGCPSAAGNAMVVCIPEKPSLSPFLQTAASSSSSISSTSWVSYYPSVNQNGMDSLGVRQSYTDDIDSLTQSSFVTFLQFITQNKDETHTVTHPITQDLIDTSRVIISSNTFLRNHISTAQLFAQGAHNIQLTSNTLQENTFVLPSLAQSVPIFGKIFGNIIYNLTAISSPMIVRLANYINIEQNFFINNFQHDSVGTGITVGSAISIDRHIGYVPVIIYNNTFTNYSGAVLQDSLANTLASNTTTTIPPLVTYSIWEKMQGLSCAGTQLSAFSDPNNAVIQVLESKFEYNIKYDKNITASGRLLSPNNKGSVWFFTDSDRAAGSAAFSIVSEFFGVSLLVQVTGCQVTSKTSLYLQGSTFLSNVNQVETSLFNLVGFDTSYINGNQFTNNTLSSTKTGEEASFIYFVQTAADKDSWAEISGNVFEFNTGRLLNINQSLAAANITTVFRDNVITNHTAQSELIHLASATNVGFYNMSIFNLTAVVGLLNIEGSSATITIQDVNVDGIKTFQKGCFYISSIDQGFALSNFACANSELHVTQNITLKNQIAFVACFTFYNQHSDSVEFDNLVCQNASIVYDITTPITTEITLASCFVLNKITDMTLQNFTCSGTSIKNTNLAHPLSYLGQVTKTTYFTLTDSTFHGNVVEKSILITKCKLNWNNLTISNNSATADATFLLVQNSRNVYFQNLKFLGNKCLNCVGGFIFFNSIANVENSVFSENQALEAPTFNAMLGQLTITGCTFYRNVALDLSSAISAEDAYLILLDSTFEENRSKGNLITFLQNWCEINYCNFIRNEAELGSKNIYANSGHLYIAFSTFIGSGGSEANTVEGDFIAVYNNDLAVEYTSFQNGIAKTGGAIAIEDFQSVPSFFHITSCDFIGNSAASNGGAIYAATGAERWIYITDSRFYNNTAFGQGGAIYAEKISSVIAYTSFTTNGSTILYLSEGTHDLENLDFTGYRQTSFAQAIYANQIDTMYLYYTNVNGFGYNDIEDSDLDPQDSPLSAFVLIASPTVQSSFYFLFNSFQNNQGLQGGAIYAQGNIMMLMLSVSFSNNKAIDGGAIYYASTSSEAVFEFSDMVKFNSNQALNSGGALKYTNKTFKFSASDTEFRDNVAIYGNNISAYGTFIVPAFYNSLDMTGTSRILENSTTFIMNSIYSSGDFIDPPFRFQIRDDLDQDVIIDNSSTVEVSLSYITNTTTPLSFSGQIPFTAVNGYVTLDSLKIHGAPGSTVQMQTRLKTLNGSSNPVSVIIQLRECMLGEMLTEDQTCYLCPNVKYTLTIGELNSCQMCPENGLCYGSNIFGPQKNFWRYSDLDNKLNECYNDEACLGAVLEDTSIMSTSYCAPGMLVNNSFCLTGWCREGYHGRMCSECGEGWAQSNAGLKSCSRCSGSFKSIGIIILLVLGGGLYVLFVIWNALNEEKKEAYYTEYSVVDPSSVQNTPEKEKLTVATFQNVGDKSGIMNTGPQESDRKLVPSMSSSTEPKFNRRNSLRLSISLSNVPLTRQNLKRHSIDMLNETPSSKSNLSPPKLPKSSRMFRMSSIYFASEIKEKEVKSPNNQANEIKILNSPTNSQEKLVNKSTPKSITIKTSKSLNKLNKASVYTKILTNYIQLASIINITDFGWPDTVKKIFAIQTALAQTSSEVFSFDCILKNSFFAKFGFSSFFAKLLIVSISPVAIIILITLIWIVIYLIKYRKSLKSIPRSLCSNIIMSIVITLFILHPTIVEFSAAAFQCATLGDDASSSTYLLGDLQLECYSPEHMKIALPIALPSLIIWGFGIPFFAWLVVFLHRNTLETYSTRARYGFLYEGCQTKFYYWEFVVFYRKVILIVISTFLVEYSVDLQAILVLGVSAGFYLLQVKIAPYETSTLNEMEKRSLIFSTLTIYCGLFCLTKQLSSSDKVVPFLVLIFANLYFLIYWVIEFLKAKSAQLLENKYCAKYCGKILTKLAAFEWKRRNAAIKDEAQHVLATAAAGLLKQDSTPDKTDTEKDNSPETEQVRQNQLDTEKQDKLNDAINLEEDPENPEDPSDITLGESDYKRKPIRDSASLRSLFSRPIPSNSGNLMLKDAVQTIPSGRQSSRHSSGTSSIFQFHNKPTFLNEI